MRGRGRTLTLPLGNILRSRSGTRVPANPPLLKMRTVFYETIRSATGLSLPVRCTMHKLQIITNITKCVIFGTVIYGVRTHCSAQNLTPINVNVAEVCSKQSKSNLVCCVTSSATVLDSWYTKPGGTLDKHNFYTTARNCVRYPVPGGTTVHYGTTVRLGTRVPGSRGKRQRDPCKFSPKRHSCTF